MNSFVRSSRVLLSLLAGAVAAMPLARAAGSLEERFRDPPPETRAWCFWYWINGQVSREGITHDLEGMKRFGIGTALIGNDYFEELPKGQAPMFSDQWWDLTVFAIHEAKRLGIDIGVFNCAGWSQSGGPWIGADQTMRFLNWSETPVHGGTAFHGTLPKPQAVFQDVAVLAVPLAAEEQDRLVALSPRVDAGGSPDAGANLVDGNDATATRFPNVKGDWTVSFETAKPLTARSLTLRPTRTDFKVQATLQVADAGGSWRTVREFEVDRSNNRGEVGPVPYAPVTISFDATTSARWRLVFRDLQTKDAGAGFAEVELTGAPRIERVMEKQLAKLYSTPKPPWGAYVWPPQAEPEKAGMVAAPERVIDLSKQLQPDGSLAWTAPAGDWTILRVGMSPTGITNHPAAPNATGPEVDKMNRAAVDHHFDAFITPLLKRLTADDRKALKYVAADSYETGSENWTDGLAERFQKRYGYDPKPWLPVLTGRIVGSADQSNRFLWDLRRLVADGVATDYTEELSKRSHEEGMKFWLENYGHWGFPAEFLQYGGHSDLVSGEFWIGKELGDIECRAASSAAHTYGQPQVWAEAFTSSSFFKYYPYAMKARGDWAFTEGINHMLLQVSITQPGDEPPGTNAWFGTEFNRLNTWFEPGKAWVDYLRRCHVLLQEGRNVADIAYFIGEDTPKMTGIKDPPLPPGYGFDYINAEVIETRLDVKDGRWTLPDGTSYALLVLPDLDTMRPAVLRKLHELVRKGGALLGSAPKQSPSLENYPKCDDEVRRLAADLWTAAGATTSVSGAEAEGHAAGHGKVFAHRDLAGALGRLGTGADVDGIDPQKILWVHRASPERDVYFVSNQTDNVMDLAPVFRVTSRRPELWDAVTGDVVPSARYAPATGAVGTTANTGTGTRVDFTLGPRGSVFVVFPRGGEAQERGTAAAVAVTAVQRDGRAEPALVIAREASGAVARVAQNGRYRFEVAGGAAIEQTVSDIPAPMELKGPWQLHFPAHRDVPESITLDKLASWTTNKNEAIKYFSGTGTYETTFAVPAGVITKGRKFFLDFGDIEIIGEASLNGQPLGVSWLPPYRLEATVALQTGENHLTVKVSNLWRNRVIGDKKYPDGFPGGPRPKEFTARVADTSRLPPGDPPAVSGLLGPVRLVAEEDVRVIAAK